MIVDKPPAPWKAIAIVSTGNFLEMFDFMVFGFYAAAIAGVFFPRGNEYAAANHCEPGVPKTGRERARRNGLHGLPPADVGGRYVFLSSDRCCLI